MLTMEPSVVCQPPTPSKIFIGHKSAFTKVSMSPPSPIITTRSNGMKRFGLQHSPASPLSSPLPTIRLIQDPSKQVTVSSPTRRITAANTTANSMYHNNNSNLNNTSTTFNQFPPQHHHHTHNFSQAPSLPSFSSISARCYSAANNNTIKNPPQQLQQQQVTIADHHAFKKKFDKPADLTIQIPKDQSKLAKPILAQQPTSSSIDKISKPQRQRNERDRRYSHGRWTAEEHTLFVKAFQVCGRDWSRIAREFVKTRQRSQVASHAQKYLARLEQGLDQNSPDSDIQMM
jgi:SHAQKYF class myb-like DNA-binding protein